MNMHDGDAEEVRHNRESSARDQTLGRMPRSGSRVGKGTYITVSLLGVLIPILLIAYNAFGVHTKPRSTVRLASVLFRHGDRTPTDTYPSDPYKDDSHWPDGWGALTNLGKAQLYQLGVILRNRYSDLLPESYSPKDVYVVSSDHDRCLMSAQLCLAALYPPAGRQVWKEGLAWQPVPVHTTPRSQDKLIVVKKPCEVYEKELEATYQSEFLRKIDQSNQELYERLSKHTGKTINGVLDVEMLYNTLEIEERNKLALPEWTKSVYTERMRTLAATSLAVFTHTETMKRLKGGPIVAQVATHMSEKVLGTLDPDRRLFLYSGHDLTIVSVLRALGIQDLIKPDNGAAVIFELHQPLDGSEHVVEVHYLNSTGRADTHELVLPGCGKQCSLKRFLEVTHSVRPLDWDKECRL